MNRVMKSVFGWMTSASPDPDGLSRLQVWGTLFVTLGVVSVEATVITATAVSSVLLVYFLFSECHEAVSYIKNVNVCCSDVSRCIELYANATF